MGILNPQPGDVFFISKPKLRRSPDSHPVLILEVAGALVTYNFMSSEFAHFRSGTDEAFNKDSEDPGEWTTSGLWLSCYLIKNENYRNDAANMEGKWIGKFRGIMLDRAEKWWGQPIVVPLGIFNRFEAAEKAKIAAAPAIDVIRIPLHFSQTMP